MLCCVEVWSRPILKRSASYRDRHVAAAEWNPDLSQSASQFANVAIDQTRNRVSIPQAVTSGFRVAPQSTAGQRSDSSHEARLANHQKYVLYPPSRLPDGIKQSLTPPTFPATQAQPLQVALEGSQAIVEPPYCRPSCPCNTTSRTTEKARFNPSSSSIVKIHVPYRTVQYSIVSLCSNSISSA